MLTPSPAVAREGTGSVTAKETAGLLTPSPVVELNDWMLVGQLSED